MRTAALVLLSALCLVPDAFARTRSIGHRNNPIPWQAPACATLGLPYLSFIDAAGQVHRTEDYPKIDLQAVAIGAAANTMYALTSDGAIHESRDAGCTWSVRASVPEVLANQRTVNIATRHYARVYAYSETAMVRLTFGTVETIAFPERFVRLGVNPENMQHLRAIAAAGGVFESLDGGSTWTRVGNVRYGIVTAVAFNPTDFDHIIASTGNTYQSRDGGRTWTRAGLPQAKVWHLEFSSADPNVIWADILEFPTRYGALWRSNDGGAMFQYQTGIHTAVRAADGRLAPHPTDASLLAVGKQGVRLVKNNYIKETWFYDNVLEAVWSPAGTLYYIAYRVEFR
jgi:hypothetical protein